MKDIMRSIFICFFLATITVSSLPAGAANKFDYKAIKQIHVVTDKEAILYGDFPAFIKFRSIIAKTMEGPCAVRPEKAKELYKVRLISEAEHRFIYIGDSWISYNDCYASLSEQDFNWIVDSIAHGKGQLNATLETYKRAMNRLLENQGNPPVTGL
ncbi:MAG TPA: hypothetical protein VFP95_02740 [Gammaproteobacteria bacterium]|nr:hypothetical protein [Gammaproteobacteria bacterium]